MKLKHRRSLRRKKIESLELREVGFGYATGGLVFDSVSVKLPMGNLMHVTGPMGHGQSTLLRLIAFLAEPSQGEILVNGQSATAMSFEEFLPWRLEIGYTFESGGLLANRTLEENIMLPQLYHNLGDVDQTREDVRSLAERFRFEKLLDRRPASVSGGLRKLVTILRPMLLRPSVLVMDDPFSGLDPDTARELEKCIFEVRERAEIETIYFTSRDEIWPDRLGAKSLWVENGRVEIITGHESADFAARKKA